MDAEGEGWDSWGSRWKWYMEGRLCLGMKSVLDLSRDIEGQILTQADLKELSENEMGVCENILRQEFPLSMANRHMKRYRMPENNVKIRIRPAHTLLFVSFHDSEFPFFLHVLHNEPRNGLLILRVHPTCFNELIFQFSDAFWIILCDQVDCNCIDHDACSVWGTVLCRYQDFAGDLYMNSLRAGIEGNTRVYQEKD